MLDLTDKDVIKQILKERHLWAKKNFGQNFLIDQNILDVIVKAATINNDDFVLEIGPGLGVLTQELAKKAKLVLAIDQDRDMVEWLRRYFKTQSEKVKIVCDDILQISNFKFSIRQAQGRQMSNKISNNNSEFPKKYKIVSNLPYNITSPVINKFLTNENKPTEMILMVQKEVAERLTAKPGNRERGFMTVLVELFADAEIIQVVPRECFYPEPNVDSAIIKLRIKNKESIIKPEEEKHFLKFVKMGFSQKRRQIHHPLMAGLHLSKSDIIDMLKTTKIDEKSRAENLSVEEWEKLYGNYKKLVG